MIPGVPAIGRRSTWIGYRREVPVEVVRECIGSKDGLLIVRVVHRRGERRRNRASREGPALLDAIPGSIVGVGQIANDGGALLIRETEQLRRRVIAIDDAVAVREHQAGAAVGIVIADGDDAGPLRNRCEPVGIVVRIVHCRLSGHGHGDTPIGVVVRIGQRPLGRHFLREPVEPSYVLVDALLGAVKARWITSNLNSRSIALSYINTFRRKIDCAHCSIKIDCYIQTDLHIRRFKPLLMKQACRKP